MQALPSHGTLERLSYSQSQFYPLFAKSSHRLRTISIRPSPLPFGEVCCMGCPFATHCLQKSRSLYLFSLSATMRGQILSRKFHYNARFFSCHHFFRRKLISNNNRRTGGSYPRPRFLESRLNYPRIRG